MTDLVETTVKSGLVDDESDEDASEAQAQVIASLRGQVTDLFSQVTQLNSKLVASYDRVSDLEDQLHDTSSSLRNATISISSLELERSHHLAALNTGLLVEKTHVTAELNRLMERATEEAAQRGQAESARHDIEKDLDDLSASLFDQANTMVAEARLNQARSERKVQDAELALKMVEDVVKEMQVQMQALQAEREVAEREAQEAKATMGKGKWAERDDVRVGEVPRVRFMTTHAPYAEFIAFVGHLRMLRVTQSTPPVISTLLSQPFLARLVVEDSEPTVRLDLAPSLNWLSRRSVLAAIHSGMLTVEPLPFSSLVQELHQHPQTTSTSTLYCALCGTLIARVLSAPVSRANHSNGSSWFKYPLALGTTQNHHAGTAPSAECEPPGQVYTFRLAVATPSTPPPALTHVHNSSASMSSMVGTSSRAPLNPISSSRVLQAQTQNLPYPLCTSNYCLTRLRSTCSLWAFVRVGIVERVWEEDVFQPSKPILNGDAKWTPAPLALGSQSANAATPPVSDKPPIPPRRRRFWEMASAFVEERAVSWGKESGEAAKDKDDEKVNDGAKKLPAPPPSHPSAPHPHAESPTSHVHAQAPPLPKRKVVRPSATTDTVAPSSITQNEVEPSEAKDPAVDANGDTDPDKADANAPDPSSPVEEITFASLPSESSPPPSTTSHAVPTEPAAPSIQDQLPPPSPHTVPLPVTPTTPNPILRVASPAPRPRSRLSSPASPPPSSRPASPAISRSRGGSPTPRAASPSPGHVPSASHLRGKISMSSPLASSAPAPGPGAPPLPRRAAARRPAPPLPPTTDELKGVGHEETSPVVAAAEPIHKTDDAETETMGHDGEDAGETTVSQAESAPETEAAPEPTKDVTVDHENTNAEHHDVEGAVNDASATAPLDLDPVCVPVPAPVSEADGRTSMDTTSTKRSSSTEGEAFASDATWEERTWKEVVRLKEDMFWARIGGIRSV